ncbi:MAG: hypothetical protein NTZ03_15730 [Actinobacteria bacterium]|nr:hypothetical protein [Actinomycetota bacterium]
MSLPAIAQFAKRRLPLASSSRDCPRMHDLLAGVAAPGAAISTAAPAAAAAVKGSNTFLRSHLA